MTTVVEPARFSFRFADLAPVLPEPALRILLGQGFQLCNEVDIFDAGPLVRAYQADIKAVKNARLANLSEIRCVQSADLHLIAHVSLFCRACLGAVELMDDETLAITAETAARLQVQPGNRLVYLPLQRSERQRAATSGNERQRAIRN